MDFFIQQNVCCSYCFNSWYKIDLGQNNYIFNVDIASWLLVYTFYSVLYVFRSYYHQNCTISFRIHCNTPRLPASGSQLTNWKNKIYITVCSGQKKTFLYFFSCCVLTTSGILLALNFTLNKPNTMTSGRISSDSTLVSPCSGMRTSGSVYVSMQLYRCRVKKRKLKPSRILRASGIPSGSSSDPADIQALFSLTSLKYSVFHIFLHFRNTRIETINGLVLTLRYIIQLSGHFYIRETFV